MIDTCRITHPAKTPRGPLNEDTGQYPEVERVVAYEGKCRIQVRSDINSNAVEAVVGDHEWAYRTGTVQLPIDGTGHILPNAVCEHLTAPLDPSLEGGLYTLKADVKGKTHSTHRRFGMTELLR